MQDENIEYNKESMMDAVTEHYARKLALDLKDSIERMAMTGMFEPEPICSHCHVRFNQHTNSARESIMNHPFFKNNLEYLEWESQQREH